MIRFQRVEIERTEASVQRKDSYQDTPSGVPKSDRKKSAFRRCVALVAIFLFDASLIALSAQAPIDYTITLTSREQHLIEVKISLPPGSPERELQLPVWNALYQVRDFSQFINWIRAKNPSGQPL